MQFSGKETTFLINDVSLVLRLTSLVRSGLENKEGILSDSFQKMSVLVMLIECLVSRCQLANRQLEFFFICLKAYQINQSPSTKFHNLYVSSPFSLFLFIEALVATCRVFHSCSQMQRLKYFYKLTCFSQDQEASWSNFCLGVFIEPN